MSERINVTTLICPACGKPATIYRGGWNRRGEHVVIGRDWGCDEHPPKPTPPLTDAERLALGIPLAATDTLEAALT